MSNRYFNTIESIDSGSNTMISWSLSIVGGSLLTILSESYIQPSYTPFRLAYLLFGVGWTFIGISIYFGRNITQSKMAAALYDQNDDNLKEILKRINKYYLKQLRFFNFSLAAFGIWLILYLIWWILAESPPYEIKTS